MEILNMTRDGGLEYFGSTVVDKGEVISIWTNGFPGVIGIVGIDEGKPDFEISEVTDLREAIRGDRHTPIPIGNGSDNAVINLTMGMSAYEIKNKSNSKKMRVNWRVLRP